MCALLPRPHRAAFIVLKHTLLLLSHQVDFKKLASEATSGSEEPDLATDPAEAKALAAVAVKEAGKWGTKGGALLRRLLRLKVTHPGDKSIVFSRFPDLLKLLARALESNNIGYVTLAGEACTCCTPNHHHHSVATPHLT